MCKLSCSLLFLTIFAISLHGQSHASQKKASQPPGEAGKAKITNPEGKTTFAYRHSVDAGLSDRSGNIWFSTTDGIYRYDGKLFTKYRVMDGLQTEHVSKMMEDKAGKVWFGALGGIVRYDASASPNSGTPSYSSIKVLAPGGNGFLAGQPDNINAQVGSKIVSHMIADNDGNIWFSIGYDLYRSDGGSGTAITTCVGNFLKGEKEQYHCAYPDDFGICSIYADKQRNIVISTMACSCGPNVTYRLDGGRANHPCVLNKCKHDLLKPQDYAAHNKEIAESFVKITNEVGSSKIVFTTIMEDRSGNIWAGSDSGVYRYDGSRFVHLTRGDILSRSVISTIYEDKSGNIWFGTGENTHTQDNGFHGNGVFRYDPAASIRAGSPSITQFTTRDGLCANGSFINNTVSSMAEDNEGRLWFIGTGGACYFNGTGFTGLTKKDGFTDQTVNTLLKDKAGNMWFGTWELGLYRYDGGSLVCFTDSKP